MSPSDPYGWIARRYDRIFGAMNRTLHSIGIGLLPEAPGARLLDLGCGTGSHLEAHLARGCRVVGLDLSPAMISVARSRVPAGLLLIRGDATAAPLPDGSFDRVLTTFVLHEMPAERRCQVLAEVRRLLAPGGHLMVIEFACGPLRPPKGWILRAFLFVVELAAGREHFRGFRTWTRSGGLPGLAMREGWTIEKQKVVGAGNVGLYVLTPGPSVPPLVP